MMNEFQKMFLNKRVIPAIMMFSLLPRCVFYISWQLVMAYILTAIFAALSLAYLIIRYVVIMKYISDKKLIIFDTLCVVVGVFMACVYEYNQTGNYTLLFCVTAIPFYVNNYKVLIRF